jgi:hypothetical protein
MAITRLLPVTLATAMLLIATVFGVAAQAANPTDLSGRAYNITITTDGGPQQDRLVFSSKDLSAKMMLGDTKLPYTMKSKGKTLTFDATQTAADGSVMDISGTITGDTVTGTITMTPKGGTAKALNYTNVKPKP